MTWTVEPLDSPSGYWRVTDGCIIDTMPIGFASKEQAEEMAKFLNARDEAKEDAS